MQCHYEVLAISRDAEDDDIKRSYRKLALKNHPDKNPDSIEECTKRFHLIQQAYEVLIDPQERAWYDKHREAILKGGLGHGDDYKDDCMDVYQYFNTSCFSGYSDGEKGFYTVYKEVFNKLAAEDSEYNEDSDSDSEAPGFGNSESSYEETVGPFYGYWEGYCTLRSYVWVEKYDTREGPNRQVRRAMEQENKKLRDKAKRERNEEVRALVAFVKKRDKRVQAYKKKLEERAIEVAKLAKERKEQSRRKRLASLEGYKETDWSAAAALEKDLESLEAGYAEEYGEESFSDFEEDDDKPNAEQLQEAEELYLDVPYCVACNKAFKTEKALSNHENSKKHRERLAALKLEMEEDEEMIKNGSSDGDIIESFDDLDLHDDELLESEDGVKETDGEKQFADEENEELPDEAEEEPKCIACDKTFQNPNALAAHEKTKKHRQNMTAYHIKQGTSEATPNRKGKGDQKEPEDDEDDKPQKFSKKQRKLFKQNKKTQDCDQEENAGVKENESTEVKENGSTEKNTEGDTVVSERVGINDQSSSNIEGERDSAVKAEADSTKTNKKPQVTNETKATPEGQQFCNVCNNQFPTRNKLFDHIKKTGHARRVLDGEIVEDVNFGKKGKKKKGGRK